MIAKITANKVKVPFLLDAVWFSQNKDICEIQIRSLSTEAPNSDGIGTAMSSLKVAPTNHFIAKDSVNNKLAGFYLFTVSN